MFTKIPHLKAVAVGVVAVGVLALGLVGIAGASSAVTPTPSAAHTVSFTKTVREFNVRQFNCADATNALARIDKVEARIAAGLPKLTAAQARAGRNGHPVLAHRLERGINRLESAPFKARLTRRSAAIEAKCHA
jgi:hypothetical protein